MKSTFLALCLAGQAKPADIDAFVERWHTEDSDMPIWEFLGLTEAQYAAWVEDPSALLEIVGTHKSLAQDGHVLQRPPVR